MFRSKLRKDVLKERQTKQFVIPATKKDKEEELAEKVKPASVRMREIWGRM